MLPQSGMRCANCGLDTSKWKGGDGEGYWKAYRGGLTQVYCCSACVLNRCSCRQTTPD